MRCREYGAGCGVYAVGYRVGDLQVRVSGARFRLSGTCRALCVGVPLANVEEMVQRVESREKLSFGVWVAFSGVMGHFCWIFGFAP